MNTVELLLKADAGKLPLPEKEIEVTRLSEITGAPVVFKIRAITHGKYEEITGGVSADQEGRITVGNDLAAKIALAGIVDPSFKNHELMEHYKALTPEELLYDLLLVGEVEAIAGEIQTLSGFNRKKAIKDVKEVKN